MPSKISVEVSKLDGEALTLNIDRQTTVLLLKHKLSELWSFPPECQKIVHGVEVLQNGRELNCLNRGKGSKISVLCVISCTDVFDCVVDSNTPQSKRESAMRALVDIAHLEYERTLAILEANLCSFLGNRALHEIAFQGLVQISHAGDSSQKAEVLAIGRRALHHQDENVRAAGAELLGCVSSKGDSLLVDTLCEHAADPSTCIRTRVARALGQVACSGDSSALAALVTLSSDESGLVREASALALGEMLSLTQDADGIAALSKLASDEFRHVRIVAGRALSNLQSW